MAEPSEPATVIRPELREALVRWREPLVAGSVALVGLWFVWLGGYLLAPLGIATTLLALGWGVHAIRRVRFARDVTAPGLVEIDEGQIGYLAPERGGFVALRDLAEVRLIALGHDLHWRLKQADGQALLVPVSAAGADKLYDAFASLPGMDTQRLVGALDLATADRSGARSGDTGLGQVLWKRPSGN
jgi:hypothetical protein